MTTSRSFVVVFVTALLLAAPGPPAAQVEETAPLGLRVSHRARALNPGEVVILRVTSSQPVDAMYAAAFERAVHLFPIEEGAAWEGLLGIDVDTPPGEYAVEIRAVGAGATAGISHPLRIDARDFETRRLTVDGAFVNPPAGVMARIARERERLAQVYATLTAERLWRGALQAPVPGEPTSSFGRLSIFNGEPRGRHRGTDFRAATGTPVRAPAGGRVLLSADLYFAGGSVVLDHGWGLISHFAHLSSRDVEEGATVEAGRIIGRVGATGRVTGPHLHWSVRVGPASVDPISLMAVLGED